MCAPPLITAMKQTRILLFAFKIRAGLSRLNQGVCSCKIIPKIEVHYLICINNITAVHLTSNLVHKHTI